MGLLERVYRQSKTEQQPQYPPDPYYDDLLSGQPIQQQPTTIIPPSLEKETMELYLKPVFPKEIDDPEKTRKFTRSQKYWPFLTDAVTTVLTSNMNANRQRHIKNTMRIAKDFHGVDNAEDLVQDLMLDIIVEAVTDKARSDFSDGIRERVAPTVGIGMTGAFNPQNRDTGERPKESRALWGLIGSKNR